MGDDNGESDERPSRVVQVGQAFDLAETEVTVGQFRAFTLATGYVTEAEKEGWSWIRTGGGPGWSRQSGISWRHPGFSQTDEHPAVCISWNDATAFCAWLSDETGEIYRLPSEAEWEYACRAGGSTDYSGTPLDIAWFSDNSLGGSHPVHRKEPNSWGVYDMHGNAWEWCSDVWHKDYVGAPEDAAPWLTGGDAKWFKAGDGRVLRGGCWGLDAKVMRASSRPSFGREQRCNNSGFRIVRQIGPSAASLSSKPEEKNNAICQEPDRVSLVNVPLELITIPAGEFAMGSETSESFLNERPVHRVRIPRRFQMGKTEVTVEQFRAFVSACDYQTDAERKAPNADEKVVRNWREPGFENAGNHPVAWISWNDAKAFCRWLSLQTGEHYRLPTEAEWEYACRAGTTTDYAADPAILGWSNSNSSRKSHPVGQLPPNKFGLHDLAGSSWEWCEDTHHENYLGAPSDGTAWLTEPGRYRILRGGAWQLIPWLMRSSSRAWRKLDEADEFTSFRLVRELAPVHAEASSVVPLPTTEGRPASNTGTPARFSRVVDLTHTLKDDFPTWSGKPSMKFTMNNYGEINAGWWQVMEHTGTHMDAPLHFSKGSAVDSIPASQLVGELVVIDIRDKAARDPDAQLTIEDLEQWEKRHGPVPDGGIVAMCAGWDKHVNTDKFRNSDEAGVLHYPGFHPDVVRFLLAERSVKGLVVDTLSVDYGRSKMDELPVHRLWLSSGRWNLECAANLAEVPPVGATLVLGIPKVAGASGGPCRAVALFQAVCV